MNYLKAFIIGLLALLGFIFVIENIEVLRQTVQLRLNLYIVKLETAPLDLWVLITLSFALGAILVFIYFIYDHLKQRQLIRQMRQNIEIMASELKRAGVAVNSASESMGTATSSEKPAE